MLKKHIKIYLYIKLIIMKIDFLFNEKRYYNKLDRINLKMINMSKSGIKHDQIIWNEYDVVFNKFKQLNDLKQKIHNDNYFIELKKEAIENFKLSLTLRECYNCGKIHYGFLGCKKEDVKEHLGSGRVIV
jgi:hypothetical protein